MDKQLAAFLTKRYDAEAWLKPEPLPTNVFVWHFDPAQLQPHNVQRYMTPSDDGKSQIRVTESTYPKGDVLLHVTTYECDSRAAARQQLLSVLGEFQGPILERKDVAGEVSYSVPRDVSAVFVRGNVVVVGRNGGPKLTSVKPLLKKLDNMMTGRLPPDSHTLDKLKPPADNEWIQLVAEGAEVVLSKGRPTLRGKGTVAVARVRVTDTR